MIPFLGPWNLVIIFKLEATKIISSRVPSFPSDVLPCKQVSMRQPLLKSQLVFNLVEYNLKLIRVRDETQEVPAPLLPSWHSTGVRPQQRGSRNQIYRPAQPVARVRLTWSRTDVDELVEEIAQEEPIITENKKPQLKTLIESSSVLRQNSSWSYSKRRPSTSNPSRPWRLTSCPSPTAPSTKTETSTRSYS